MSRLRSRSAVAAVALTVLLTPALAGCFQNPIEAVVEQGVEEAIKGATGVEVDVSNDGASVPSDWPSSIPLPDGRVSDSGSLTMNDAKTWTVTVRPGGDVATVFADARAAITGAGLDESFVTEGTNDASGMFGNDSYTLLLTVAGDSGETVSTYVLTEVVPQ